MSAASRGRRLLSRRLTRRGRDASFQTFACRAGQESTYRHALKARDAALPLILITGHGDIPMAVNAIKEGAFDFIEKPFDYERLIESIVKAIEHGDRAQTAQAQIVDLAQRVAELSERQREVMDRVVQGLSNKEIAHALGISPRTVENYRAWVMEKMGATNLADLVRKVLILQNQAQ